MRTAPHAPASEVPAVPPCFERVSRPRFLRKRMSGYARRAASKHAARTQLRSVSAWTVSSAPLPLSGARAGKLGELGELGELRDLGDLIGACSGSAT